MQKFKKFMAAAVAATMVMGLSLTAFAADTPTPVAKGESTGAGTTEGYVEMKVLRMLLPTIPTGSTPFAYTMDPERLIASTSNAKYDGYTFPSSGDTGVYFRTGDKEFANESVVYDAVNKSSCDVKLTVRAEAPATQGANDIDLAEKTDISGSETSPKLYLALKVGQSSTAAKTIKYGDANAAEFTGKITGTTDNFEIKYNAASKKYEYVPTSSATWKAVKINMEGKVSDYTLNNQKKFTDKKMSDKTTAPTIKVTWSFVEAASGDSALDEAAYTAPAVTLKNVTTNAAAAASSTEGVNYDAEFVTGKDNTYTFSGLLEQGDALKAFTYGTTTSDITAKPTSITLKNSNSITISSTSGFKTAGTTGYIKVTTNEGKTYVIKVVSKAPTA